MTLTNDGRFVATYGFLRIETPLANVDEAHVTTGYRWWTAVGARLSFADDGLTFGTNAAGGVRVHFHTKVPSALRRKGHSALTVTDGAAWVGLVPFFMRVATPGGHRIAWMSHFCETNVRTYVRDLEGRSGIWFFSLDAARLGAVVAARTTYRLPYFWSRMRIDAHDHDIAYDCRRRAPGPRGLTSTLRVRIGVPLTQEELNGRDHFLTARWVLFSSVGDRARFARAWHAPWPLHAARVLDIDDRLVTAAGLPSPEGDPVVHYSPGVDVRIGRPERYPSRW